MRGISKLPEEGIWGDDCGERTVSDRSSIYTDMLNVNGILSRRVVPKEGRS
jgi:hypothetical protein